MNQTLYQIKRFVDHVTFFFLVPGHPAGDISIKYTKEYLKVEVEDSFHPTEWGKESETVVGLTAKDNERLDFSDMTARSVNGILEIDVPIKLEWQEKTLEITPPEIEDEDDDEFDLN